MPSWTRSLHPALAPWVPSCVGYDYRLPAHTVHHGLPSPGLTVILSFDEPLDCGWLAADGQRGQYWMLIGGLHLAPALIRTHGIQHGIQLSLSPLGVRQLLGRPTADLTGQLVPAGDVAEAFPDSLHARLADADWPTRFALLEAHLLNHLSRQDRMSGTGSAEVDEAWRLLAHHHGRLDVAELAIRVGWSRRHLAARFSAEFGVSPKQASRLARFDHARDLARSGVPLAEAAHACGYADQAHLGREWRGFAALTPTATLTEFPILLASTD